MTDPDVETNQILSSSTTTTTTTASARSTTGSTSSTINNRQRTTFLFGIVIGLVFIVFLSLFEEERFITIRRNDTIVKSSLSPIQRNDELLFSVEAPPPPPIQQRVHRNITLIVELKGELGNQLSVLANARITQYIAQTMYPYIHIQLIGQHQSHAKWVKGRNDLINCFSSTFHNFEFSGGIHDTSGEFKIVQELQQSWLTADQQKKLVNVRSFNFLNSLLLQQEQQQQQQEQEQNISNTVPQIPSSISSKYSLPYLTANSFSWWDVMKHEGYYNDMRQWMLYNFQQTGCCSPTSRPKENDIVFHYRNFAYELKGRKELPSQFVEISSSTIANVALQNYTRHHDVNVAIMSRYESGTQQYIKAFRERDISSYFVTGHQSGTEGFCFIVQTQKESFGAYQSTYYRWAAVLGNATLNRFYMIDQSPIAAAAVAIEDNNNNYDNNDTAATLPQMTNDTLVTDLLLRTVQFPPIKSIQTFQRGNRTFTIEVYRQ